MDKRKEPTLQRRQHVENRPSVQQMAADCKGRAETMSGMLAAMGIMACNLAVSVAMFAYATGGMPWS